MWSKWKYFIWTIVWTLFSILWHTFDKFFISSHDFAFFCYLWPTFFYVLHTCLKVQKLVDKLKIVLFLTTVLYIPFIKGNINSFLILLSCSYQRDWVGGDDHRGSGITTPKLKTKGDHSIEEGGSGADMIKITDYNDYYCYPFPNTQYQSIPLTHTH